MKFIPSLHPETLMDQSLTPRVDEEDASGLLRSPPLSHHPGG